MKCCSYVVIHTESDHELPVLKKVRQIKGVEDVFRVYGPYDIFLKTEPCYENELKAVIGEIKGIQSVRGVSTLMLASTE